MGIFSKSKGAANLIVSAGSLAGKIGDAFDKNFTSQEEKMEARNELMSDTNKLIGDLNKLRQEVIVTEASGSKLQRNWRPVLMLTFGGIIVCTWVLFPLINIFVKNSDLSGLINSLQGAEQFWNVVKLGLGGYVIGRSVEKVTDSVGKNMNISIGKGKKTA